MLNRTILQGRMVADPELKKTQSGVSSLTFTVAWSRKIKEVETKCFLRCKAWRERAEMISRYFVKGQEIIVEGTLETETWETKDGQKRSDIVLAVSDAHFCGKKEANACSNTSEPITHPESLQTPVSGFNCDVQTTFQDLGDLDQLPF